MRGTFVFPEADTDFIQLLELRGNNGGTADVETVYVLTGETYYVPTRLVACDDPDLYMAATSTRVNAKDRTIARAVARYYREQDGPKHVTRVHTHPNAPPEPSEVDRNNCALRKPVFDRYFDDYEFFLGIHALREHDKTDPEWLRRPEQTATNEVSWWGEHRKHTLAIFDAAYEPRPVVLQ